VQTICLDKTGTLTLNRMSVVSAYTGMRRLQVADGTFIAGEDRIDPLACEELVKLAQVCVLCKVSHYAKRFHVHIGVGHRGASGQTL